MNKALKLIILIGSLASFVAAVILCCIYIDRILTGVSEIKKKFFDKKPIEEIE